VHIVPWTVNANPHHTITTVRHGLALIGGYRHAPNVDAARWLAEVIMPLVWQARPDIACYLVGGDWPERVGWLTDPRIIRLGSVDRLDDLFETVRVSVAPLRFGAGIKGKVLDSFAAGIPCIMTPIAAEGLDLPKSLQPWIGDTAAALASLILRAHTDTEFTETAENEALDYIAERHNWPMVQTALARALLETKSHRPHR
jgi:hypothetical protein